MWPWLKKWWIGLAGGALAVVSFIIGFETRKTPVIVQGGPDPLEKKTEDENAKEDTQAEADARKAQQEATDAHAKDVQAVVVKEQGSVKELESNGDDENTFIKKVGQEVQGK